MKEHHHIVLDVVACAVRLRDHQQTGDDQRRDDEKGVLVFHAGQAEDVFDLVMEGDDADRGDQHEEAAPVGDADQRTQPVVRLAVFMHHDRHFMNAFTVPEQDDAERGQQ